MESVLSDLTLRRESLLKFLTSLCKTYKEKYPLIQIALHTATADTVYEMMKKGLVDRIEFNISIRHNKIMGIK